MIIETLTRKITDANLPLEQVTSQEFWKFWKNSLTRSIEVASGEMMSSTGPSHSLGYATCHGFCLFGEGKGMLGHMFPRQDPAHFLTGKLPYYDQQYAENPVQVFKNPEKVSAVHVYHTKWNDKWKDIDVDNALKSIGITKVVHIPIKSRTETMCAMSLMIDPENRAVYIYTEDFETGLKYQVK